MNKIFLRDFTKVIATHPESWNKPCILPRDADCGTFLNAQDVFKIDPSLKVIEWKTGNVHWTHFDEIYIDKPTRLLNKLYIGNVQEYKD
mgnify:CR=1 FL=1